jgi:hypothetical protein
MSTRPDNAGQVEEEQQQDGSDGGGNSEHCHPARRAAGRCSLLAARAVVVATATLPRLGRR